MLLQNLYQPFEIEYKESISCPIKSHRQTFFELIYIIEGEGTYHINQNKFEYKSENLFLVMPFEDHHTVVKNATKFLFIRFNNIYLTAQKTTEPHSHLGDWIQKLEFIFQNSNHQQGCIIRNASDKPLVKAIAQGLVQEYMNNEQALQKEVMQQLINTLITIVARNISKHINEKTKISPSVSLEIINYIHLNIYNSDKLKAESIASHFNISVNYISEYFKKHTGENLQQYIIGYKISLVETRLRYSDLRLNEIAYELGFTDESHLTKTFKKHKGINPTDFKRQSINKVSANSN